MHPIVALTCNSVATTTSVISSKDAEMHRCKGAAMIQTKKATAADVAADAATADATDGDETI